MKVNFKRVSLFFSLTLLLATLNLSANEKMPTLLEMLKVGTLKIDYKNFDSGEIFILDREDQEITDTSIALTMGLYVKAPFKDVVQALKDGENSISNYSDAMVVHIKDIYNINPYFVKLSFTKREKQEVDELFDYDDGELFNLSEKEIKRWHTMAKKKQNRLELASSFFREVLEQRTKEYMKGGVSNISSYEHSDSDATVTKGFQSSSLGLNFFKRWFPELYRDYIEYPKVLSKKYEEKFYWIKDEIEDRPVFILKHQMVEEKENVLVIAERQFYISNGLDAIQTQILCMPHKDGTFVALSSQSFTKKVSGFARGVAVEVGRHMMSKEIVPVFESLQKKFNH